MDITEIQDELLRLEYPNLLPDHDPDIERYYYLRSIGQSRDALLIYQNRLVIRYPENDFRTWLMRSYRSHDPAFRSLLARGYRMLGARSLERVKQILLIIAEKAESYNEKDVYSTIKTAEEIRRYLAPDRYEAMAGMERYLRYASALNLKVPSIAKATELIRAYMTDTLSIVEEERRKRSDAQRQAEEMERQRLVKADWDSYHFQKKYGISTPFIDLSMVNFSPEDLNRIEIPPFNRIEDQILGYCIKYWNTVDDPAFERILFLYSRKYGKKNYDVYMAIRRGQQAKLRDDEILASIMSFLVTGYYYSIQGDLYLQRSWNTIKRILANQEKQKLLTGAPAAKQIESKQAGDGAGKKGKQKKERRKQARIAPKPKAKAAPKIAPKPEKTFQPGAVVARPAAAAKAAPASRLAAAAKPAEKNIVKRKPTQLVKVPQTLKPAQQAKTTIVKPAVVKPTAAKQAGKSAASRPKTFNVKTLEKAKGSVSDRLKKLSGRSYDVYEDRFLAKARVSIRKVLGTGKGIFFNLPEEAEDLVYNYLRDHYSDPYMDWENSTDRKNLMTMGFDLPSINPVIDECYRVL